MLDKLLKKIKEKYILEEVDVNEFSSFKAKGMKFSVQAYHAKGLGHISVMKAVGFFGLMKMDTLIIVPNEKDLPLYSYDRIFAMGNDTLIVELYDTIVNKFSVSALDFVKNKYNHISERDPGEHWYDYMKLSQSISKKGKKKVSKELDLLALEHFDAYLDMETLELTDFRKKNELSSKYVKGLLEHGGPSTNVFIKMFGQEKTKNLYRDILFGVNL
jgi:hypothetical protein